MATRICSCPIPRASPPDAFCCELTLQAYLATHPVTNDTITPNSELNYNTRNVSSGPVDEVIDVWKPWGRKVAPVADVARTLFSTNNGFVSDPYFGAMVSKFLLNYPTNPLFPQPNIQHAPVTPTPTAGPRRFYPGHSLVHGRQLATSVPGRPEESANAPDGFAVRCRFPDCGVLIGNTLKTKAISNLHLIHLLTYHRGWVRGKDVERKCTISKVNDALNTL
ncbi:uncharacterized protein DFL_000093 [Arthrobotrys flagrans]|uniref:Uncharacterized protein n=1 Tax=Arthrobotrys flagrans TaxID=97331 RepID=A0A437ADC3_ARTFL|nr:hypothetical protein DFL_000093 [Arthrobotrys flagrans]